MTPSAELLACLSLKSSNLFVTHKIYEIPSRLVSAPSQWDVGDQDEANAQTIPDTQYYYSDCDNLLHSAPKTQLNIGVVYPEITADEYGRFEEYTCITNTMEEGSTPQRKSLDNCLACAICRTTKQQDEERERPKTNNR